MRRSCNIVEGGGMYDDLWTCRTCGHQRYPEVFRCPRARPRWPWLLGGTIVGAVLWALVHGGAAIGAA